MNSKFRTAIALTAVVTLIALLVSCSSGNSDDESTPNPSSTATAVTPTAQPTVTATPTPTNTPGPTPTPAPTATPSPTPTATPTPPPPGSHVTEMGILHTEKGIDFSTLSVASVGAAQWPNAALGCPEPGAYYDATNAPYSGTTYVLTNGSQTWEYHSNEDDSVVVRCSEIEPSTRSTTNIADEANLQSIVSATLMRRDFSTDSFEPRRDLFPDDAARIATILSQDVSLTSATPCTTVFRLDFVTQEGTSEFEFICEDNYSAFDLYWNGLHGTAPIFGDIIGPYLTGDPIPSLPTATP